MEFFKDLPLVVDYFLYMLKTFNAIFKWISCVDATVWYEMQ